MAQVVLQGLTKHYPGGVVGVQDLTLTIASGELLTFVGPSGCGKTTTLRLIAGLEQPTAGSLQIGGRDVTRLPPWERQVALVGQRPTLFPHLSVADNLAFSERLHRRRGAWLPFGLGESNQTKAELLQKVRSTAELLGLEAVLQRRPGELSGGQQQRVALGRALVRGARVLLLDEPFASLDAPLRHELRRELHLLHRRLAVTIIHVTHDPTEALTLGDRVAVLQAGRLIQVDQPEVLWHRPRNRMVAGFLGWPAMNFLEGELKGGVFLSSLGAIEAPAEWSEHLGKPVAVGLRPEAVEIVSEEKQISEPPLSTARHMMKVTLIERLGDTAALTCERDGCRLTALAQGSATIGEGREVMVCLNLNQGYLFDGVTGETLAAPRTPG